MEAIRNEKHEIIGYRQEQPDGQVKIRDKHAELVGWTTFGQSRAKDGTLVSFQENEASSTCAGIRHRPAIWQEKSPEARNRLPSLSSRKLRG